jgi:hypothetical protein
MTSSVLVLLEPFRSVPPIVEHAMLRIYIEVIASTYTSSSDHAHVFEHITSTQAALRKTAITLAFVWHHVVGRGHQIHFTFGCG